MASFGFSWADEVEREEREEREEILRAKSANTREEAEEHHHLDVDEEEEKQRPKRRFDPSGDARPREVVLEEKGVDWRKLDLEFNASSVPRFANKMEHSQKMPKPIAKSFQPQKQKNHEELAPPLRYPPKDDVYLMEQIRGKQPNAHNAAVDNGQLSHYRNTSTVHRMSMNPEHGVTRVLQYNMSTVELGHLRRNPNIGRKNTNHAKETNCERSHVGAKFIDQRENVQPVNQRKTCKDDSYYSENMKDIRGKYAVEIKSTISEESQSNGRRILSDRNMRTDKIKKIRITEPRTGSRHSGFQDSRCPSIEPQMWLHNRKNGTENTIIVGQNHGNEDQLMACRRYENKLSTDCGYLDSTCKGKSSGKDDGKETGGHPSAPKAASRWRKGRKHGGK